MKKLNRKYSFPVLSIVAIGAFFIFTGGVLEENNTLDTPPTITFTAVNTNSYKVGSRQQIYVKLTNYDPSQHDVTESCDLIPNTPDKNSTKYDTPESFMWMISPTGTDSVKLNYYFADNALNMGVSGVYVDQYNQASEQLMVVSYSFNTPGNWKLVCRARTVSRTAAKYVNGTLKSGGELLLGAWVESSYTITIGGTAILPQQKYTFKSLEIVPAAGDPSPRKTFIFSDPARQYLEVLSPTKANLKFYWTPTAADAAAYPNLASKYEFNYQNANYILEKFDPGYNMVLYFKGQLISFQYSDVSKSLTFKKYSKKLPSGSDSFNINFQ